MNTPKGMRDIDPQTMMVFEDAISKIKKIYILNGYKPLETPALEYIETLTAKAGEEAKRQIFQVDEYGLRFDHTVSLARYASNSDDPKPFKRYSIGPAWRKEEPQRGRFRQFYQADADIVGTHSIRAEVELLSIAKKICNEFGFNSPRIMVNSRKILDGIAEALDFQNEKEEVFRILDKLDKLSEVEFEKQLFALLGVKSEKLLKIIRYIGSNEEKLLLASNYSKDGADEIRNIISLCDFEIEVDLYLVRGLGYYTGPIFEIKLQNNMGTVISGGRYDKLLSVYGQDFPAVGISVGLDRLVTLLIENNPIQTKTRTTIYISNVNDELYKDAIGVASKLREAGISVETDLSEKNLKKQFEYANAQSIPYVLVLGKKEIEIKKFPLKDMKTGNESVLSLEEIIEMVS